jgi:hydantoinase/carbamoylase family amidase
MVPADVVVVERSPERMHEIPLVVAADIERHYLVLDRIGCLGESRESGYLRAGYSAEESAAHQYIAEQGSRAGFVTMTDTVGNLYLETPGFTRFVEVGSHLDTVPAGGNFDGAAGVVCGLEAMRAVAVSGVPRRHGLRLCVWRLEEGGTFNRALFGSLAAYGAVDPSVLDHRFRGLALRDAVRAEGFDPTVVERGEPALSRTRRDSTVAHLELHIEQASALERSGEDIGIITSIRGPWRSRVVLEGRFDHSGGTPMGTEHRQDANLAFAYIAVELDRLAAEARERGNDLVQTIGVVNTDPSLNDREPRVYLNATSKVSGYCYFVLDVRSDRKQFRDGYVREAMATIQRTAERFGVTVRLEPLGGTDPHESLDPAIADRIEAASARLGYRHRRMASGALHDVVTVGSHRRADGTAVPIGMIFIPCRDGISHNEAEFTTNEAMAKGANVLAAVLAELAA